MINYVFALAGAVIGAIIVTITTIVLAKFDKTEQITVLTTELAEKTKRNTNKIEFIHKHYMSRELCHSRHEITEEKFINIIEKLEDIKQKVDAIYKSNGSGD